MREIEPEYSHEIIETLPEKILKDEVYEMKGQRFRVSKVYKNKLIMRRVNHD